MSLLGTPRSRTDPSIWIKFITSPVTRFDAKVIVEPDTVNELQLSTQYTCRQDKTI